MSLVHHASPHGDSACNLFSAALSAVKLRSSPSTSAVPNGGACGPFCVGRTPAPFTAGRSLDRGPLAACTAPASAKPCPALAVSAGRHCSWTYGPCPAVAVAAGAALGSRAAANSKLQQVLDLPMPCPPLRPTLRPLHTSGGAAAFAATKAHCLADPGHAPSTRSCAVAAVRL